MAKYLSKSLSDTSRIAGEVLVELEKRVNQERATVLLLEGDLGSGKTTFTQVLAKHLGVRENLVSPTFVLIKSYRTKHHKFKKLVHLDAYRLDSGQDLERLGWNDLVTDPANLIVLEWPERVADLFAPTELKIDLKFIDQNTRAIQYEF
ncbi:MAG: tRNA (adenosine(37)-N6)-threonylcarbamoyltransferase complex ATPase subunit type 1 TsaE [Candidatus Vogelbacteria bacterium CG10_big_fil_rev_8_21_14_0_10_49_38]|uniref:tRNA threonylcarbamoyladenosine biosynthesis protein TsaE n=1 Tax=Candidatus Vogelbacteria bacterium CG10_big_fil_rev_8_21_14_0_10_49_38 TaxID=1975043 RepID=A0A2H0RKE3_9BACT|nr:MAG: tRNA (adenosine(37)-N6)-threonylcarbamoyltransferase complex ATPase subunit type 1 TsaE [bacterium CG10_49_38]PIR46245.1 MAG: tRNA (adenosine(37)-N6)-threonylcarbamoyltransferase complex ATPase subunit type 1 TsaE [Candidatus Vogelbacteria bacterium CG10_big_fil_rev_8_21_14_0_10_49_38]